MLESPSSSPDTATLDSAEGLTTKSISPGQMAWRRYRKHRGAMICSVILLLLMIWVLLSPITARYGVNQAIFKVGAQDYIAYHAWELRADGRRGAWRTCGD